MFTFSIHPSWKSAYNVQAKVHIIQHHHNVCLS